MPRKSLSDHAADVLADGPLPLLEIVDHVLARTTTRARDPHRAVRSALNRSCFEHDGLWWHVPVLASGRVLTHRMTQEELDDEVVPTGSDLSPLQLPTSVVLASNRGDVEISHLDDVNQAPLSGSPGWLADVDAGDVLAVRRQGLTLQIDVVKDLVPDPAVDAELQHEAETVIAEREAQDNPRWATASVRDLLLPRFAADAAAFTVAGPPLSERFGAGLELSCGLVARAGFDWSVFDIFEDDDEQPFDADLFDGFGLDGSGTAAALQLLVDADVARPGTEALRRTAEALSDDRVAGAVTAVIATVETPDGLRALLAAAAETCEGKPRAACLVALARAEEQYVQDLAAEQALLDALEADPHFVPALIDAARYAEDRGEAQQALDLLRRAGMPSDDDAVQRLRPFAEPPATGTSRNAPCPCGSGRKHKACCLLTATHSLSSRAPWLREKVAAWALEPSQREAWLDIVLTLGEEGHEIGASFDPFVQDLGIWGTELLESFRWSRDDLLPGDEVALLDAWMDVRPRLFETVAVGPRHLTLRDVIDDTLVEAAHPRLASELRRGELLVLRVLPDGEDGWITGGILPVPRRWRSRLVPFLEQEPDGLDLAEWIAAALAPPTLTNKHGNELVLCAGLWRPVDLGATIDGLEDELDVFDQGSGSLHDDEGSLVLEVQIKEGLLGVSTTSREQWPLVEELVARVAPNAVEVAHSEVAGEELREYLPDFQEPNETSPEVRQILIDHMKDYERKWVEDAIPALGGSTPREALADPELRKELLELLADFDDDLANSPDPETVMNADRIRTLLGLA